MQQRADAKLVGYVIHIPTGIAYAWIFLGFVTAGMLLYAFFMAAAFKINLLRGLQQWSAISKLALFSGPPLIALGLFFSTIQTSYYMLIPLATYYAISTFTSRSRVLKSKEPP
jgi:hypothetical protein